MGINRRDFNLMRRIISATSKNNNPDVSSTLSKFFNAAERLEDINGVQRAVTNFSDATSGLNNITGSVDKSLDIISKIRRMRTPPVVANPSPQRRIVETAKEYALPAALVLGASATAKNFIVDPVVQAAKSEIAYAQMPKVVPQLENKDDREIRRYFNVIKTFSPKSATNPLVAGALVNKMMEFGGVDHKLIQDLSAMQKNINDHNFALNVAPKVYEGAVGTAMKGSMDDPFIYGPQYKAE